MKEKKFKKFKVRNKDFNDCVQVAIKNKGVAIRDSAHPKRGMLFFSHQTWTEFINVAKKGGFDITSATPVESKKS